jgi:hypothetical protein
VAYEEPGHQPVTALVDAVHYLLDLSGRQAKVVPLSHRGREARRVGGSKHVT